MTSSTYHNEKRTSFLVVLILGTAILFAQERTETATVSIKNGTIEGQLDPEAGAARYCGIPFAKPPVISSSRM